MSMSQTLPCWVLDFVELGLESHLNCWRCAPCEVPYCHVNSCHPRPCYWHWGPAWNWSLLPVVGVGQENMVEIYITVIIRGYLSINLRIYYRHHVRIVSIVCSKIQPLAITLAVTWAHNTYKFDWSIYHERQTDILCVELVNKSVFKYFNFQCICIGWVHWCDLRWHFSPAYNASNKIN